MSLMKLFHRSLGHWPLFDEGQLADAMLEAGLRLRWDLIWGD